MTDCYDCYTAGGFIAGWLDNFCYCQDSGVIHPDKNETCPRSIPYCEGTSPCDESCLSCLAPGPGNCTQCPDDTELVTLGNVMNGACEPPCDPYQYRDLNGVCQNPNCSGLGNCYNNGQCLWDGTKPVCLCNPSYEGDMCDIPRSPCPGGCSNHGICLFSTFLDLSMCVCTPGWYGAACSVPLFPTVDPISGPEVGGTTITLYAGFVPTDVVIAQFAGVNFTATINGPNAYVVLPPYHTASRIDFAVFINDVEFVLINADFYVYSSDLPTGDTALTAMRIISDTPLTHTYTLDSHAGSTVVATIRPWNFSPFDPEYLEDPVLGDPQIIYTGPNTGMFQFTLNVTAFDWTMSLYVISVCSGYYCANDYLWPVPVNVDLKAVYQEWMIRAPQTPTDPPADCGVTNAFFDMIPDNYSFPQPVPGNYFVPTEDDRDDLCIYQDNFHSKADYHLWEPFLFHDDFKNVVQFFVSTMLPKLVGCHLQNITVCQTYLSFRSYGGLGTRSLRAPTITPAATTSAVSAVAFVSGNEFYYTLDGLSYIFSAVGEFVLLKDANSTFVTQVRSLALPSRVATYLTNVVIQFEKSILEVTMDDFGHPLFVFNHVPQITTTLPVGGEVWVTGGGIFITRAGEFSLRIKIGNNFMFFLDTSPFGEISMKILAPPGLLGTSGFAGLLGNYDGNPNNDLFNPAGEVLAVPATPRDIHAFQMAWMVAPAETLFTYPLGLTFANINSNPGYVPQYVGEVPYNAALSPGALITCSAAADYFFVACVYSVLVTGRYDSSEIIVRYSLEQLGSVRAHAPVPVFTNLPTQLAVHYNDTVTFSPNATGAAGRTYIVSVVSPLETGSSFQQLPPVYSFLVTGAMFLTDRVNPVLFGAMGPFDESSTAVATFSLVYSTCSSPLSQLAAEAALELEAYCGVETCTANCNSTINRIRQLPCHTQLEALLGKTLTDPEELCNPTIESETQDPASWLTSFFSALGAAIFLLILGIIVFVVWRRYSRRQRDYKQPLLGDEETRTQGLELEE